ncbi:MAG: hypothetical protein U0638_15570 [Phycisphaerales bacterium]
MANTTAKPRSRTRRAITIAMLCCLFVALGAATTTAVAWGIALSRTKGRVIAERQAYESAQHGMARELPAFSCGVVYWPVDHRPGVSTLRTSRGTVREVAPGLAVLFLEDASGPYVSRTFVKTAAQPPDFRHAVNAPAYELAERRYGWPARSYWYLFRDYQFTKDGKSPELEGVFIYQSGDSRDPSRVRNGANSGFQPQDKHFAFWLPIYILPLGFTFDTLFYAANWFICLFGIRSIRHALRTRRGLCTRCAYDLKGLAQGSACPECGSLSLPAASFPSHRAVS